MSYSHPRFWPLTDLVLFSVDDSDGNVIIPAGVALAAPPGGSVSLKGANLTVDGSITAPGGSINLTVTKLSIYGETGNGQPNPPPGPQ